VSIVERQFISFQTNSRVMTWPVSRRTAAVERDLQARGSTIQTTEWVSVVPDPPADVTTTDAPLAVVPVTDGRPVSIVSAVENAARREQLPVLVTDRHTRPNVRDVLSSPVGLAGMDDGRRRFYPTEDRIRLTDDTFGCVDSRGSLQWAESKPTAETDSPAVQLTTDSDVVAVLDSVASLTCPGPEPSAFPARYTRTDGRFQVLESDSVVGTFGTVSSMRADGYRPIPRPLVPEHHLRHNSELARKALLAVPDDSGVTYEPVR
jgi:hypothetical protein